MLDAIKAFDRVNYCKLFATLLKRSISPIVVRLLLFQYTHQSLRVMWGSTLSKQISVMNGVKQGGVLSPILFAVYTNGLLERLKNTGVGCHMGSRFVGALASLCWPHANRLFQCLLECVKIMLQHMILCLMGIKVSCYSLRADPLL